MNPGIIMLIFMSAVGLVLLTVFNFDRILVFLLRLTNAPVCGQARMIAASIYQHPEQWKPSKYELAHEKIGTIWIGSRSSGLHVDGPFGQWLPNLIERRIIHDAVAWHRNNAIQNLLRTAVA